MYRNSLIALTAVLLCGAAAIALARNADENEALPARASEPMRLVVAAQPIAAALNDFARQSGLHVVIGSEIAVGVTSNAVEGMFTANVALEKLLANTGLRYEYLDAMTVAVLGGEKPKAEVKESAQPWRVAQENPGGNPGAAGSQGEQKLEEVVVTAQKRRERLQDVPISISVLNGRELDRANYLSVNDALNVSVPGVATSYSSFPGTTQLSVRGVTAPSITGAGSSPIAYYVDSVPFGFVRSAMVPDVGTFDLQQVEALRGPQGTLYGANAVNGVIRVLTHDADLNKLEFKARTSVSGMQGGDTSYRGDLAVNVPLIEDKFAARLVGSYAKSGGWIDNLVKRDTNDTQLSDVRLKLNAQPSDQLSLGLSYWHSNTDIGAFNLANSNDVYPGILDTPTTVPFDTMGLKVGYELPVFSVSSMTSYIDYKNHNNYDVTPFAVLFAGFGCCDSWYGQLGYNEQDSKVFAQEINLSSKTVGPWRWTAGAFYRDAKDHYFSTAPYLASPLGNGVTSKSFAAFGELTRDFLGGRFALTGGLRYFTDDVTTFENLQHPGALPDSPLQHVTDTFHKVSPRVVLNWHPVTQMTAYASYGEGFRSGFSQDAFVQQEAPGFPPVKPDTLHNYEVGVKGALLDGRITYDSAVYYMDWRDLQQSLDVRVESGSAVTAVVNGYSASGPGIDLNLMTQPLNGLEFGFNLSWNDLTFDKDVLTNDVVLFHKGDRPNYSPEYTFGTLAAYAFPLGAGDLRGRFSVSGSYHTEQLARSVSSLSKGNDLLDVHLGLSLEAPEHWTAELFVDNATNNRGNITTAEGDGVPFYDLRTRPRTIGLQVEYRITK